MGFWNAGNQAIRESDFAPSSPLRLEIPKEVEVFDIRITAVTAQEIRASLDLPRVLEAGEMKSIPVHFDYLDGDDGFSIQIIHDAVEVADIKFTGKLPGVDEFKSSGSDERNYGLLSPLAYRPRVPHTSQFEKWVLAPIACIGLGGVGVWFIHEAVFGEFHWYQIPGGLMVVYLALPFTFISHVNPPRTLIEAAWNKGEEPNK